MNEAKLVRCPGCGHQPHPSGGCLNMASDSDCACTVGTQAPQGERQIDFHCHVCGVVCAIAPDPPARVVCPKHCEDHDYIHDSSRAAKFCQHCDQEQPEDWR